MCTHIRQKKRLGWTKTIQYCDEGFPGGPDDKHLPGSAGRHQRPGFDP